MDRALGTLKDCQSENDGSGGKWSSTICSLPLAGKFSAYTVKCFLDNPNSSCTQLVSQNYFPNSYNLCALIGKQEESDNSLCHLYRGRTFGAFLLSVCLFVPIGNQDFLINLPSFFKYTYTKKVSCTF